MRRMAWMGFVACCFMGIACGGGGGGGPDATGDPGMGADVGPEDVGAPPDTPVAEEGGADAIEAVDVPKDPGGEVADAGDGGPDAAEVPACGEECSVTNEHGTCKGWRACVDGGLGECDARTPEAEVCDGVDNDCDGETDEDGAALCDDGVACTADACDGEAGCAHPVAPGACWIGGECYRVGDISPQNECLFCLPQKNPLDWSPRPGGCDDGNICTKRDTCEDGTCVGKENVCECEEDQDCAPHEDGNPCNGTLFCNHAKYPAVCEVDPGTVVTCDATGDTKCKANLCDPATGQCAMTPVFEGEPCDDAEACTYNDRCAQGVCVGTPSSCDDLLPCTEDRCDGAGGCDHVLSPYYCVIGEPGVNAQCVPHGEHHPTNPCLWCNAQIQASGWSPWSGPCDDGDACTAGDACIAGTCVGEPYVCDDGLDCTVEACDALGGCVVIEVVPGFCWIGGACVADQERNPDNECLWCDPVANDRTWSQHNLSCDDGNLCTTGDRCMKGVCVGGPPPDCDDDNLCTDDRCDTDAGGCVHVANEAPCDDGNPCTVGDRCAEGLCQSGPVNACECESDADCPDDGDACNGRLVCDQGVYPHRCVTDPDTVVTCDKSADTTCSKNRCIPATGACQMTPVNEGGACDDANACTHGETCQGGVCLGTAYDCEDGLACTDDICRGDGTCDHVLKTGFCLIAGSCVVDGQEHPDNACLVCDPASQKYTWTAKQSGTPCDDGEVCTHSDACKAGQCRGVPYGCDDRLSCTQDACLGDGTCSHTLLAGSCLIDGVCHEDGAEKGPCLYCNAALNPTGWTARGGTACDDGQACTKDDRCDPTTGQCIGTPYACNDGKWCTLDACRGDGTCDFLAIEAGACLIDGACYRRGDEDPEDPCRRCWPENSQTAWTPKDDGTACSDHDECTVNDRCQEGTCVPGPARVCDDGNPCTTDQCAPEIGCVFQANDIYREDFEQDIRFVFENSDPDVGWQVVTDSPLNPSAMLYYGNPMTGDYDTPGYANQGTALSQDALEVAPWEAAFLSFDLYLDTEWSNHLATGGEGRQSNDVLDVFLSVEGMGEVLVWSSSWGSPQWWVQTSSGVPIHSKPVRVISMDLAPQLQWLGYPPFRVGFRFQTGDDRMNGFGGVWVDNIMVGRTCDDGNACTTGDTCQAGQCVGLPAVCDDANDCTGDSCDPSWGCQHPPVKEQEPCDDHDLCTEGTTCTMGWCSGGTPVVCEDDFNDCTSDACMTLKGCAYPPVPDFSACTLGELPNGTCLLGMCTPWELFWYQFGEYGTGFYTVERVEEGPLSVSGYTAPANEAMQYRPLPAVFDLDIEEATWDPIEGEGILYAMSGRLAAGYEYDPANAVIVPRTAAWDGSSWVFDPELNPAHVPADSDAALFAVAKAPGSNEYFAGGFGQVGSNPVYIERCSFDPITGTWIPCEPMAAVLDPWGGCEPMDFTVVSIWALSDSNVWAAGSSIDGNGIPWYTILYYDGNLISQCGEMEGLRGVFSQHYYYGLHQPSNGNGSLLGIHGRSWDNVWAVGTDGKIFARVDASPGWRTMDPTADGIAWDESHTSYGVYVEDRDVHIVGTTGDQVPFYLHARRTDDWMKPWVFDRKIEFWEFSDSGILWSVVRDPLTGAIEAVGHIYDVGADITYGIRARIAPIQDD